LELNSIIENQTWEEVDEILASRNRPIQSKFVFDLKRDEFRRVVRLKARLCARGDMQEPGRDYGETYSSTLRLQSVRLLLAIAAKRDLEIHQMDAVTAFLNANSDKPILMRLPSKNGQKGILVRLLKSLYGLKQSGKLWADFFRQKLLELGWIQNPHESCIYSKVINSEEVYLGVYVDDLIICAPLATIEILKKEIASKIKCTDGGELHHILHLKVTRNRQQKTIKLSQPAYIAEVLADMNMTDAEYKISPEYTTADQYNSEPLDENMKRIYGSNVGKCVWLARATHPEISHNVHLLSKQLSSPRNVDWLNLKKLMRYLSYVKEHGINLGGNNILKGFCDANWITPDDEKCRSTSGYVFTINGPISWSTKLQTLIAQSTCEAEFLAANYAGREAVWLDRLAKSLGHNHKLIVYCDNKAAISLVHNPDESHTRTKHINVKAQWVKQAYDLGWLGIEYISTKEQLADMFTKILSPGHFKVMCDKMKLG
jgi:hypothetical protein